MEQTMTKEEFDFFKNEIVLRRKFSSLYPFVKSVYGEITAIMPEMDRMILDRLNKTNAKFSPKMADPTWSDFTNRRPYETSFGIDFQRSVFLGRYELERMSNRIGEEKALNQKIKSMEKGNINFFMRFGDSANLDKIETSQISGDIIKHLKLEKNKIGTNEDYLFIHTNQHMPLRYYDNYIKAVKRESFIHELLHALAYCEMGRIEFENFDANFDDAIDFDVASSLNKIDTMPLYSFKELELDDFVFLQNGADIESVFVTDLLDFGGVGLVPVYNSYTSHLKEEAIVEGWASEIAEKCGVFDDLDRNNIVYERDYGTLPFIASMFNIACDEEWKVQHIKGMKSLRCEMQDANKMDELFSNYISCFFKDKNKIEANLEETDIPKIISAMKDIVLFCDEKVKDKIAYGEISKEDEEKYRFNKYMFTNMDATSKFLDSQGAKIENKSALYLLKNKMHNEFRTSESRNL